MPTYDQNAIASISTEFEGDEWHTLVTFTDGAMWCSCENEGPL